MRCEDHRNESTETDKTDAAASAPHSVATPDANTSTPKTHTHTHQHTHINTDTRGWNITEPAGQRVASKTHHPLHRCDDDDHHHKSDVDESHTHASIAQQSGEVPPPSAHRRAFGLRTASGLAHTHTHTRVCPLPSPPWLYMRQRHHDAQALPPTPRTRLCCLT